ncbi:MAG: Vi polysaccharide biosynthesis UDP-N-acetylglucosamine C-6 dehydrogenase TviB, partial [Pseudomonadota bacterium]|nr:Vi polysaccharide biosynthesis UDP-N-acetylglucosamine C-6 dehydrogenase TviB [Pseudomonadota bacterium]
MDKLEGTKIAIIGLGYVGLPLAIEFGKQYSTLGFDISEKRIAQLNDHVDETLEVESEDFQLANQLTFSCEEQDLKGADVYIV